MRQAAFLLLMLIPALAWSQEKYAKPYKPPVLKSSISSFSGKQKATIVEAKNALTLPLIVKDAAGNLYKISSYQFLYKQRTQTEDEVTGEIKPATSMVSQRFKESPLPKLWLDRISEDLKPGEELYFFDIIVKDDKGRVMYAPEISITIK